MSPVALGKEVMGEATMVVALPIIQTPTMVEVAIDRPPQPAVYLLGMGQGTGSNSQSSQGAGTWKEVGPKFPPML